MKYLLFLLFPFIYLNTSAQIKEINPLIGWNYIKSEEIDMTDGVWYNSEFDAETGYDYIFILNHKLDSAKSSIQVFDLQDVNVATKNKDNSKKIIDLTFDVKESGVYRVFFGLNDLAGEIEIHKVQFMLVRRKKV
ncbi:MAG: hypothetical protein IT243_09965 [Bacteroidia bacterium]|nr:hypothetical protein [Bacteroidia bacterium]